MAVPFPLLHVGPQGCAGAKHFPCGLIWLNCLVYESKKLLSNNGFPPFPLIVNDVTSTVSNLETVLSDLLLQPAFLLTTDNHQGMEY